MLSINMKYSPVPIEDGTQLQKNIKLFCPRLSFENPNPSEFSGTQIFKFTEAWTFHSSQI